MSQINKSRKKIREEDAAKLGSIISMVFLPLREADLVKSSTILRQARLSLNEFVAWVYSNALIMNMSLSELPMFDWVSFVRAFVLYTDKEFDGIEFVRDIEAARTWVDSLEDEDKKNRYRTLFDLETKVVSMGDKSLTDIKIVVEFADLSEFSELTDFGSGFFDLDAMIFSPVGLSKVSVPLTSIGVDALQNVLLNKASVDFPVSIPFTYNDRNMVMEII